MTLKDLGSRIYYGWRDALAWSSSNLVMSLIILCLGVMLIVGLVRAL